MHGSMIDMHCHFLPGIDDGPEDLETSLEMARIAVDDGIYFSVLTPHIQPGKYENDKAKISLAFSSFKQALEAAGIPLRIAMASEVRLDLEVIQMFGREEIPFLGEVGGEEIVLLELPHSHIPLGAVRFVERLIKQNIRPIIAHPERNQEVIRDVRNIYPFISAGCRLQLTAGSLTGVFGRGPKRRARQLLENDVFKVLATDAHNLDLRPPILSEGVAAAAAIIGEQAAQDLVYKNPASILFGRRLAARRLDRRSLSAAGLSGLDTQPTAIQAVERRRN